MHYIAQKIGIELSSSNALWSWAMRHACWVLNRFNTNQGMSSYELVTGKSYKGATCVFGEPLFGYSKTNNKGSARWSRMLFLGKVDPQDSFILYNGSNLVFGEVSAPHSNRLAWTPGILCQLQVPFI